MAELTTGTEASCCCPPAVQESCCEPSEKRACCGTSAASGSCGCSAGQAAEPVQAIRETVREKYAAAALAAVHNQGIAERSATFDTEPVTDADVKAWLGDALVVAAVEG